MILLLILSSVSLTWAASIDDSAVQDVIVNYHNNHRAAVSPPSYPGQMQSMSWSSAAAADATSYLEAGCSVFDQHKHNCDFGQNLYQTTGHNFNAAVNGALKKWWDEEANYNQAGNTCSGVCGHYTQMAWASTTGVGCAYLQNCTDSKGTLWGNIIHCFYEPKGNMGGRRPYINSTVVLPQAPTIDSMEVIPGNKLKVEFSQGISSDFSTTNTWFIFFKRGFAYTAKGSTSSQSPQEFDIPSGFTTAEFKIEVGSGAAKESASQTITL